MKYIILFLFPLISFSQDCPPFWDPFEWFGECGCTLSNACNFDPNATYDDNTNCILPPDFYNCDQECINDMDQDMICDELEIEGCTDQEACNYNSFVIADDGSCNYITSECDVCENNILIDNDLDNDGICDYIDDCVITLNINQSDTIVCPNTVIELNTTTSSGSFSLEFPNINQNVGNAKAISNNTTDFNLTTDFTIEFWLKDESNDYWSLMGNNSYGDNSQGWLLKKPSDNLMFAWTYDPNEFNFHNINLETWEHVAVCYDDFSNKFTYFKNGELISIEVKDAEVNNSMYEFIIGHEAGAANWFKGKIDNLRISNISRYAGNFNPFESFYPDTNTIAMYNFNEGVGNIAYDLSGNNRNLVLLNTKYSEDTPVFDEDFTWSNGDTSETILISPTETTTYTVELYNEDQNCYSYSDITIVVDPFLDCNIMTDELKIQDTETIHNIDILGRRTYSNNKGFTIQILEDGKIIKKQILK